MRGSVGGYVTHRMGSGSGRVAVAAFERGYHGGSNGASKNVAVAVLTVVGLLKVAVAKNGSVKNDSGKMVMLRWGEAVTGCSWCRWIDQVKAVRMVSVGTW
jgi:hypothetical protein